MAATKQFRETLWFKKGMLDTIAADTADGEAAAPVDTLPVEDRYLDDGSVTHEDSAMFSVRTGGTQYLPALGVAEPATSHDALPALVGEMKRGRRAILAVIAAAAAAACVIIAAYVA